VTARVNAIETHEARLNVVVDERPGAGTPRPYEFPFVSRTRLPNGVELRIADLPGRPLVSAALIARSGAVEEPPERGGATILAARALTEGTERYDAIELVEAAERLGASLHAEASWDAISASVDVPAERLEAALELLAEVVHRPTFPAREVDRMRDERLNDLLQARADPRRRADEVFTDTIYTGDSPYHRPSGGTDETVRTLDRDIVEAAYRAALDPGRTTVVVAGEVGGIDVEGIITRLFGEWRRAGSDDPPASSSASSSAGSSGGADERPIVGRSALDGRRIRLIHRPGSVQSEIRIGHVGVPRRAPDYHAMVVAGAILGGLFNSRLNMKLREEKGYTYGAGAGWDLRRGPGPFAARAAVNSEVTVPAVLDFLTELARMRDEPVTPQELAAARDYLVGVFPIRFETPGAVLGAVAGLAVHRLPDSELTDYRAGIEAVTIEDVQRIARERIDLERLAIVLVGDADQIGADLEAAGLGAVEVERDEGPTQEGATPTLEQEIGPIDSEPEAPVLPIDDDPLSEPLEEPGDGRPA
jgi:zinc protease